MIRRDLLTVVGNIERGETIRDAFRKSPHLLPHKQDLIESGELSGTLERSFKRIAVDAAEKLRFRLGIFQQIFTKLMGGFVVCSILMTLASLIRIG